MLTVVPATATVTWPDWPDACADTVMVRLEGSPEGESVACAMPFASVTALVTVNPPEEEENWTGTSLRNWLLVSRTRTLILAGFSPLDGMVGESVTTVTEATLALPAGPLPLWNASSSLPQAERPSTSSAAASIPVLRMFIVRCMGGCMG